ncbi:MAG: hypothetical protein ACREDF_06125, partial [Thermoplasmata archaeon]
MTHKVTWKLVSGQPVGSRGTKVLTSASVGDVTGDGEVEILVGSNEEYVRGETVNFTQTFFAALFGSLTDPANGRFYAVSRMGSLDPAVAGNPSGPFFPGWPAKIGLLDNDLLPFVGHGVNSFGVLANFDPGTTALEIAIHSVNGPGYILRGDGTSLYGTTGSTYDVLQYDTTGNLPASPESTDFPLLIPAVGTGAAGFLNNDGVPEYVTGGVGTVALIDVAGVASQEPGDHVLLAWDAASGDLLDEFPLKMEDLQFIMSPA